MNNQFTTYEVVEFIRYNLMKPKKITAKEIAKAVKVTEASMSRWLNHQRKMPLDVAVRIFALFGYRFAVINYDGNEVAIKHEDN